MSSPNVSIIVPVYQVESYIGQCVDSLLGQTMEEIEIILVDDGSPDDCPQICDEYAAKDRRVKVLHQENAGVSRSRNSGIELASADWIMFADPDDWLERDAAEVLYKKAIASGCDIVYSSFYWSYENGEVPAKAAEAMTGHFHVAEHSDFFVETLLSYRDDSICMGAPWGKLYRRTLFDNDHCCFPDGMKRRQDAIFNLYMLQSAHDIYIMDIPTYHYRQRESSVRHRIAPDQRSIFKRINAEVRQFLQRFQLWPDYKKQYSHVVLQGIFDLCTLCAENIGDRLDSRTAHDILRSFCEEEDCQAAIQGMGMSDMRCFKETVALYLLKHRKYRTIIQLLSMRKRCSRKVRSV
ncbi:MAG: glycosyltransferase family 2 protein [Clostridia bacterium]|nr:glycosyltransferase family 2 protein [Clostridia bacterium]